MIFHLSEATMAVEVKSKAKLLLLSMQEFIPSRQNSENPFMSYINQPTVP